MILRLRALLLSALIRRRALRRSIFGSSPLWRAVTVVVYGRRFLKLIFEKNAEYLGTETLEVGQLVQIEAIAPTARRERRGARRRSA